MSIGNFLLPSSKCTPFIFVVGFVTLLRSASKDEVVAAFAREPRVALISASQGVSALNAAADLVQELGRPRGDMWVVGLWEDILTVEKREIYYAYQVDNQAIAVPENIDAIRALSGREPDAKVSIERTNKALGIRQRFL